MHCEGRGHGFSRSGPRDRRWSEATRRGQRASIERAVDDLQRVPNLPFRDRFVYLRDRKQITSSDLCVRMGWVWRPAPATVLKEQRRLGCMKPDTTRALRVLGMRGCQDTVTYETAVRLCDALGMDPFEAGI